MTAPANIRLHTHLEGQGDYPHDPRWRVGTDENGNARLYTSKEVIDLNVRYKGMLTVDDNGTLWMLKGGTANGFWIDVFGTLQTLAEKDQANGYAGLDANRKLDPSVLPALAIGETHVEASEAAMLALGAQIGDVCKRTDEGKTYILQNADASVLGNWVDISSNTTGVETVNGKSGAHITLLMDDIPDTANFVKVTPAQVALWTGKQDALGWDEVPTANSVNAMRSGDLFTYLATIQSSLTTKTWTGADADGNNRFHLDAEDDNIQLVVVMTEGGIVNHEGTHFTVDPLKKYIEWNTAPDPGKSYYLKYLSNVPVVSLTSVAMDNVEGLTDGNGKIREEVLPEGIGSELEAPFRTQLTFEKNYVSEEVHRIAGPTAFTIDNTGAKLNRKNTMFLEANGIDKPAFSPDFVMFYDNWDNTNNTINVVTINWTGSKALVHITYV